MGKDLAPSLSKRSLLWNWQYSGRNLRRNFQYGKLHLLQLEWIVFVFLCLFLTWAVTLQEDLFSCFLVRQSTSYLCHVIIEKMVLGTIMNYCYNFTMNLDMDISCTPHCVGFAERLSSSKVSEWSLLLHTHTHVSACVKTCVWTYEIFSLIHQPDWNMRVSPCCSFVLDQFQSYE